MIHTLTNLIEDDKYNDHKMHDHQDDELHQQEHNQKQKQIHPNHHHDH